MRIRAGACAGLRHALRVRDCQVSSLLRRRSPVPSQVGQLEISIPNRGAHHGATVVECWGGDQVWLWPRIATWQSAQDALQSDQEWAPGCQLPCVQLARTAQKACSQTGAARSH